MDRKIKKVYQKYFGIKNPYDYQIKVAKALLEQKKSVILRAPTGAGKTSAAVAPFLLACEEKMDFPRRLIYSLPLRILVNVLKDELNSNKNVNEFVSVTIQTGEQPNDRLFRGDIIFATIDQTLGSFLKLPVSVPYRSANINAGAIISSFLVFDEVHLLDFERSFATVFGILSRLREITPFVVMTATLPLNVIEYLKAELGAIFIDVSVREVEKIPNQAHKKRFLKLIDSPLKAHKILDNHKPSDKTIIMCNTVNRAQQLYLELKELLLEQKKDNTKIILIHSRFLGRDREEKERQISKLFEKKSSAQNVILISTQVIEVGMNISCNKLHTELCPVDSFLQRVGRCARFPDETGEVFVYKLPEDKRNPWAPYEKEQCEETEKWLARNIGKPLDWEGALLLTEQVLARLSIKWLDLLKARFRDHLNEIIRAMSSCDGSYYSSLIRSIDSVNTVILSNPKPVEELLNYESISLSRKILKGFIKKCQKSGMDWAVQKLISDGNSYFLQPAKSTDINGILYILSPQAAHYSSEIGLCLLSEKGESREFSPLPLKQRIYFEYEYIKENWLDHTEKCLSVFKQIKDKELGIAAKKLSLLIFNNSELVEKLALLSVALHDTGKLTQEFQSKVNDGNTNELLAHSGIKNEKIGFPHAPAGACILANILKEIAGNLIGNESDKKLIIFRTVLQAIATHHNPVVKNSPRYKLSKGSENQIEFALKLVNIDVSRSLLIKQNEKQSLEKLFNIGRNYIWEERFLYLFLVRIIRLSDRFSFYLEQKNKLCR